MDATIKVNISQRNNTIIVLVFSAMPSKLEVGKPSLTRTGAIRRNTPPIFTVCSVYRVWLRHLVSIGGVEI